MEGFDFAAGRPGARAILAAGRGFVCRYVGAYAGDWRATDTAELDDYLRNGVNVVLNFEGTGKDATSYANGVRDARTAQARAAALGHPGAVIYFSIDEQSASAPVDYFRGVESVIGHARAGAYGGWDTVTTLHNAGVCSWFWMTYAWQFGRPIPPFVHIYQYRNGQTLGNVGVDYDRALQPVFGQIGTQLTSLDSHPLEEDMPLTSDDIAKVAAAVWQMNIHYGTGDKSVIQAIADLPGTVTAGVWGQTVNRSSGPVTALQELADAKTGTILLQAQVAALSDALAKIATGNGSTITAADIQAASEAGAKAALAGLTLKAAS